MKPSTLMEETFYAAVLGSPIAHSKSPTMHRAVYQHLGLPIKYDRIEVTQDQVDEFMHTLTDRYSSIEQLAGFSVTMPLKGALVPHMDSLSDRVKLLGVLNTVVFDDTGRAQGYNTDVDGIRLALTHAGFTSSVGGTMGILGAGGTATAAVAAAAEMPLDATDFYVRIRARPAATRAVAERLGLTLDTKEREDFIHDAPNAPAGVSTLPADAADSFAA